VEIESQTGSFSRLALLLFQEKATMPVLIELVALIVIITLLIVLRVQEGGVWFAVGCPASIPARI
jgi:hypothetical protein